MKRLTAIVFCSALALVGACNKDSKKDQPAKTETAGSAAAPVPTAVTAGQAAAGQAAAAAQVAVAADQANAAGQAANAAGQAAAAAGQAAAGSTAGALSDADVEKMGAKLLTVMEGVGDAIANNGADCGQMATAVEKVLNDNAAALSEIKAQSGGDVNDVKFQAWMTKNQPRVDGFSAKIGPGMAKCSGEARMQEAFAKLTSI